MTASLLSIGSLTYLARLCRRWGGEIVFMPKADFHALHFKLSADDGLTIGPDGNHAVDRPNRRILAVEHQHNVGTLIHEMGHAFLAEAAPSNPGEFDWLGWEIVLARRAGCYRVWSKQNAGYAMNLEEGEREWGELTAEQLRRVIADRIDYARKIGIVSQRGEPLCTRKM